MSIDHVSFFDRVRSHFFIRHLSQSQASGQTALLDLWEASESAMDDR